MTSHFCSGKPCGLQIVLWCSVVMHPRRTEEMIPHSCVTNQYIAGLYALAARTVEHKMSQSVNGTYALPCEGWIS